MLLLLLLLLLDLWDETTIPGYQVVERPPRWTQEVTPEVDARLLPLLLLPSRGRRRRQDAARGESPSAAAAALLLPVPEELGREASSSSLRPLVPSHAIPPGSAASRDRRRRQDAERGETVGKEPRRRRANVR